MASPILPTEFVVGYGSVRRADEENLQLRLQQSSIASRAMTLSLAVRALEAAHSRVTSSMVSDREGEAKANNYDAMLVSLPRVVVV